MPFKWDQGDVELFEEAVFHLDGALKATPKAIMDYMGNPEGLQYYHVKNRLEARRKVEANEGAPWYVRGYMPRTLTEIRLLSPRPEGQGLHDPGWQDLRRVGEVPFGGRREVAE